MTEKSLTAREAADHLYGHPDEFLTIPWGLRAYVHALVDHARATSPGDDRGRELADAALVADGVVALYRPSARLHPWHCYNTSTGEFIECRTDEQVAGYHRIPGTRRAPGPVAPAETEADVDLSAEVAVIERILRNADLTAREVKALRAVVVQATESTKWVDEGETRWDMAEALGFELVEDAPSWRDLRDAARLAASPPAQCQGRVYDHPADPPQQCGYPAGHDGECLA